MEWQCNVNSHKQRWKSIHFPFYCVLCMEREYMLVNRILLFRFWAGETKSEREGGGQRRAHSSYFYFQHISLCCQKRMSPIKHWIKQQLFLPFIFHLYQTNEYIYNHYDRFHTAYRKEEKNSAKVWLPIDTHEIETHWIPMAHGEKSTEIIHRYSDVSMINVYYDALIQFHYLL